MFKPLEWLMGKFSIDMGIDLGTANTLVTIKGQGIVLNEPSVVAVKKGTNEVLLDGMAVGAVAREMLGKAPGNILAIRPLKSGVIADFEVTEKMLRYFITKVHNRRKFVKPQVVIAVPYGINAVQKRAVINSAERAGARRVYLIEQPMAAGLGAGLAVTEPRGSMVVDIGGGTTGVAVISLAGIVHAECLPVAGDDFDEAIIRYMRTKYNLLIGELTAEKIKVAIGSALPLEQEFSLEVKGRDYLTGLPRKAIIGSDEVREALREPLRQILEAIKSTLEKTPPELAADLVNEGITLAGGGALLRRIDGLIAQETELPVKIAEDPLTAVARGTGISQENLAMYSSYLAANESAG